MAPRSCISRLENNENPDMIKVLLEAGLNLNARDKYGYTPLLRAAWGNKNPDVIKTLLAAGADLKAKTKNGSTPLHLAAQNNENPDMIEALLAAGAKLEARDEFGSTPLHRCGRGEQESGHDRGPTGGRSQTGREGRIWQNAPA